MKPNRHMKIWDFKEVLYMQNRSLSKVQGEAFSENA